MTSNLCVRPLTSLSDQIFGRMVFDQTWAKGSGTEITPNLLQALIHGGAYLSGAFIGEKCVGASFAFPATTRGLHLHSHMTAVLAEFRDQGIGNVLKIDQWHWAKKNNYQQITWTFDPLVSRNAKVNLLKLGADIVAYYPNFYGEMLDVVNVGDETDRLMASWKVVGESPIPRQVTLSAETSHTLIAIPSDIVTIRNNDLAENLRWRHKVRNEFLNVLSKGGEVVGFSDNNEYVVKV